MKPSQPKPRDQRRGWLGSLRDRIEHLLSPSAESDPLYLTNRTLSQRLRPVLAVAVPLLLVVAGVIAGIRIFAPKKPAEVKDLTPAEMAAKLMPNLSKDLQLDSNRDLDVLDVQVRRDGVIKLTGNVRSNADHLIPEAYVVFDLTDANGSELGGVTVKFEDLPKGTTKSFEQIIEQKDAVNAQVREVHSR